MRFFATWSRGDFVVWDSRTGRTVLEGPYTRLRARQLAAEMNADEPPCDEGWPGCDGGEWRHGDEYGHWVDRWYIFFVRDNYTCQLCGERVDFHVHHNNRLAPTIDHIIPQSVDPTNNRASNVRLAHRSCNSKRGTDGYLPARDAVRAALLAAL